MKIPNVLKSTNATIILALVVLGVLASPLIYMMSQTSPSQKIASITKQQNTPKPHVEPPPPPNPRNEANDRNKTARNEERKPVALKPIRAKSKPTVAIPSAKVSTKDATGSQWDSGSNIVIPANGVLITYDNVVKAKSIDTSADNNDVYFFEFYLNNKLQGHITLPPKRRNQGGLAHHTSKLPVELAQSGFNEIRIFPSEGDKMYSIGHINFK